MYKNNTVQAFCFNSTLVQLKANGLSVIDQLKESFNSTLVQLKVYIPG